MPAACGRALLPRGHPAHPAPVTAALRGLTMAWRVREEGGRGRGTVK